MPFPWPTDLPNLPPYLIFPSKLAYHTSCALREVMDLLPTPQADRLRSLLVRLVAASAPIAPQASQENTNPRSGGNLGMAANLANLANPLLQGGVGQAVGLSPV